MSPLLRLGAPGGECKDYNINTSYCWGLLHHTQAGTNYFTGQTGIRINFVAFHKKGLEPTNSDVIMAKEIDSIHTMHHFLPGLKHVPIFNELVFNFKH